jgi:serine/threonine protein kinase
MKTVEIHDKLAFKMEYLPFRLDTLLSKEKFSFTQLKHLVCFILRGIAAGHKEKIPHRDIKPSNILLDEKYVPRICDWGLSTDPRDGGTRMFMAPELFDDETKSRNYYRADAWSVGLVIFYIYEGKYPVGTNGC